MQRRLLRRVPLSTRLFSSAAALAASLALKRLPAGVSGIAAFLNLRDSLFYVDKAAFIPDVEKAANVSVLLRPKRWGKSVFLKMLASYYDAANAASPLVRVPVRDTPLAYSFTILKFDVANVARALSSTVTGSDMQSLVASALDAEVRLAVANAVDRYNIPSFDMMQPPSELLRKLGHWAQSRGNPLYIFVDEYDAVLRTTAIGSGAHALSALAGRQGPLREFFGRFKYLVDADLASRVFMTGISAVGLEAMHFNITTDLSQKHAYNAAVGFTRADTLRAIAECVGYTEGSPESSAILATLTRWCDGHLFASELDASEGMYQSEMVVQLLDMVLARRDKSAASLHAFLETWVPSYSVAAEPDRELMDYYAPSAAMATLLPKLVSGKPLATPMPLAALSVLQQVAASAPAAVSHPFERGSSATALQDLATAAFDVLAPIDLNATESTVVRTLFYEGLLTHVSGQVAGLRVSNDFMQQHFVDKFAQHLASDKTLLKAAEGFILRGETRALEKSLEASCAPGLIWQGVFKWLEFDCSQRLQLLLSIASQTTHFRWTLEEAARRVRSDGTVSPGRTDVSGVHSSGRRVIHIEVKQVHLVWDLEAFRATVGGTFNAKSVAHQTQLLAYAKRLRRMNTEDLLALKLNENSIKQVATARDVLTGATEQAREYARGWMLSHAQSAAPLPQLALYAAVAFGPLRWLIVPVSLES